MNSRVLFDEQFEEIATPSIRRSFVGRRENACTFAVAYHYGIYRRSRPLHCGISVSSMSALGHSQPTRSEPREHVCPLLSFSNASRLFSRLYGIRENRALGSLAAGRVAESDWASVWEAIIVNLFSAGPTRGNSSPATAPRKAGIDTRRARGNIQSYSARSIGAIDSQVAGPLALVGEQGNQPQWRL